MKETDLFMLKSVQKGLFSSGEMKKGLIFLFF